MFIFASLVGLDSGLKRMLKNSSGEDTLIVFERYKACPPYSNLPVHYRDVIAEQPGVKHVMPVRFLLSFCGTTTDLVAIHGVEPLLLRELRDFEMEAGSYEDFAQEKGAALVGQGAALKYGWQVGQLVTLPQLRGISFTIRGFFSAPGDTLEQVVLVDREYLEQSIDEVGRVTLFMVKVADSAQLNQVAADIDSAFANYERQTKSGPEKSFIAGQIQAFTELVRFAQMIAWLALVLLLAGMANSVSMSVNDRLREMALLKLVGFASPQVSNLVLLEFGLLGLAASLGGVGAVLLMLEVWQITISVEGFSIKPALPADMAVIAVLTGIMLSLFGTWIAVRSAASRPILLGLKGVD
jgi:putative ABC transport system permease protein